MQDTSLTLIRHDRRQGIFFTYNNIAISWRSIKQSFVATSFNHSKILALPEANRECIWLRSLISHIKSICNLNPATSIPTEIFEDNAACITQVRERYIKRDRTKHISPKFFYIHELQ